MLKVLQCLPRTCIITLKFLTRTPEDLPDLSSNHLSTLPVSSCSSHPGHDPAALLSLARKFFPTGSPLPWSLLCLDSFFPRPNLAGTFLTYKPFPTWLPQRDFPWPSDLKAPLPCPQPLWLKLLCHVLHSAWLQSDLSLCAIVLAFLHCVSFIHHPPPGIQTLWLWRPLYFQHQNLCQVHRGCISFCCCITNYHHSSESHQHSLRAHSPGGQKCRCRWARFYHLARVLDTEIKVSARLSSCLEALEKTLFPGCSACW